MFDKFKHRYTRKNSSDLIEQATEVSEPINEPELLSPDLSSPEHLLKHLVTDEKKYPDDIKIIQLYLNKIQAKVKNRLETELVIQTLVLNSSDRENSSESSESSAEFPSLDSSVELILPSNRMVAFLCILPPVGKGVHISQDMILSALEEKGVVHGIDTDLISRIVSEKSYAVIYAVARGIPAVNGQNGEIVDRFLRTQEIHLVEDERGSIDYKSLNLFQSVKAGDIICQIIRPTPGEDGHNIYGKVLKAMSGKMPSIPKGENTSLNEDETALVSDIGGIIDFVGGVFCVNPQLVIAKDVDSSTGNLHFTGDILIKGDIHKGFSVNASGDVIVLGMAESAYITAGKNIEIKKGMNGGGSGTLEAGGDIHSHFLEQTKVTAGGNVTSQAIVNCQVVSGGSIYALDGIGSIIAGSLTAYQSVEAKRIGNLSNIKTFIKIGHAVRETENEEYLSSELKKTQNTLEKIDKNVHFLEYLPEIPAEKQELYKTLKEQQGIYEKLVIDLSSKLTELANKKFDYSSCHVRGDIIYGITSVSLGYSRISIQETTYKCNIYCTDGGVLMQGTF